MPRRRLQPGRLQVDEEAAGDDAPVDLAGEVGAAAESAAPSARQQLERLVERGRAGRTCSRERLEHAGARQRQRAGPAAGGVRERVRDRGGGRHDRRLAEALGADVGSFASGTCAKSTTISGASAIVGTL